MTGITVAFEVLPTPPPQLCLSHGVSENSHVHSCSHSAWSCARTDPWHRQVLTFMAETQAA